jgi:hypothetical protein
MRSFKGHERRFRDVGDVSALPPIPQRVRHCGEPNAEGQQRRKSDVELRSCLGGRHFLASSRPAAAPIGDHRQAEGRSIKTILPLASSPIYRDRRDFRREDVAAVLTKVRDEYLRGVAVDCIPEVRVTALQVNALGTDVSSSASRTVRPRAIPDVDLVSKDMTDAEYSLNLPMTPSGGSGSGAYGSSPRHHHRAARHNDDGHKSPALLAFKFPEGFPVAFRPLAFFGVLGRQRRPVHISGRSRSRASFGSRPKRDRP